MTSKHFIGGGLTALAAALAFTAVPAAARPVDGHDWPGGEQASADNSDHGHGRWSGGDRGERAVPAGPSAEQAPPQRSYVPQPAPADAGRQAWAPRGGEHAADGAPAARGGGWRDGGERRGWAGGGTGWAGGAAASDPRSHSYAEQNRNTTYVDPNRNTGYREQRRDNDQRDWRDRNTSGHEWRNDGRDNDRQWRDYRGTQQWSRGTTQQWNRNWRSDNRYDWQRYRTYNRNIYRGGTYYAPYRGYSYRRLGIGFYLDPLFFGQSYWINDPFYYRLPDVYGPYRWVRYYDDALLVDVYTGEVVDVIYDFFW